MIVFAEFDMKRAEVLLSSARAAQLALTEAVALFTKETGLMIAEEWDLSSISVDDLIDDEQSDEGE